MNDGWSVVANFSFTTIFQKVECYFQKIYIDWDNTNSLDSYLDSYIASYQDT